jgi:hypothetical protein
VLTRDTSSDFIMGVEQLPTRNLKMKRTGLRNFGNGL